MSTSHPVDNTRDYNTISPSARSLLLLKGYTKIPFALEAAELILSPEPYIPDYTINQPGFWIRVLHFEARYLSIDTLLADLLPAAGPLPAKPFPAGPLPAGPLTASEPLTATGSTISNILELSSGFSFRGLALTADRPIYYIDTDLPELIETKQHLIDALKPAQPLGHYEIRPLNALDEAAFTAIIDSMPPGPVTIVNEGLLMYLGKEEKQQLCQLIRKTLLARGGYWITADIYLKRRFDDPELQRGDTMKQFLEKHNVYENMFETFEEATEFFTSMGFVLDKEAEPDYANMSTLSYFVNSVSPELRQRMGANGKVHATWRLRPAP